MSSAQLSPTSHPTALRPDDARALSAVPFKKAIGTDMLPIGLPYWRAVPLAAEAGFEAVEVDNVATRDEAEGVREAARGAGLTIHSVRAEEPCAGGGAAAGRPAIRFLNGPVP